MLLIIRSRWKYLSLTFVFQDRHCDGSDLTLKTVGNQQEPISYWRSRVHSLCPTLWCPTRVYTWTITFHPVYRPFYYGTKQKLDKLQRIQNTATRLITVELNDTSTSNLPFENYTGRLLSPGLYSKFCLSHSRLSMDFVQPTCRPSYTTIQPAARPTLIL